MNDRRCASTIDHSLVARAQARATGANAHDVHSMLASYYGLSEVAGEDPACEERLLSIEQRLRAFCQTGRSLRVTCVEPRRPARSSATRGESCATADRRLCAGRC